MFGYKGKQVRDNIHSHDVVSFMQQFIAAPRQGEVYNIGGGRANSVSILEAFDLIASISGKPMLHEYIDQNRQGDHICYISNLEKMKAHYPGWSITKSILTTFQEIHQAWIKVAEKGTEAAAATAVIMMATAAMPVKEDPPRRFSADDGFRYFVSDDRNGGVVVAGWVVGPMR